MVKYSNFSTDYKRSLGRLFPEENDSYRTCFMRDRDRIIHSSAFRRLKYKTQVFVYHEEDYYRTRLSHSLEVSQLARSLAKIFNVNDDLAESISLSHDLGHTPFGHSGEDALNYKMKKYGGFNHNFQTLKILTTLEKKYLEFDGLNLTFETLDGVLKHNGPVKKNVPAYIKKFLSYFNGSLSNNGSFEAQVSAICDDIAYNNNDIDDALHAGLFRIEELEQIEISNKILKKIQNKKSDNSKRTKYELVRKLIKLMIDDLISNTNENLKKFHIKSYEDVKLSKKKIVCFSDYMKKQELELKLFLNKNMYAHPTVKVMTYKAKKIVSELFDLFVNDPDLLPKKWNVFKNENEKYTNISDYISGMTDKYAINIHKKFFNLYNF